MKKIKEPVIYKSLAPNLLKEGKSLTKEAPDVNYKELFKIGEHTSGKLDTVEDIIEIFPDIELSIEIVTSLIQSPNDMGSPKLNMGLDNINMPTDIKSLILDNISLYINKHYNIEEKLDNIISESLFTKGAYIEANIPPKDIKDLAVKVKKNLHIGVEELITNIDNIQVSNYKDEDKIFDFVSTPSYMVLETLEEIKVKANMESKLYKQVNDDVTVALEDILIQDNGVGVYVDNNEITYDKPIIIKMDSSNVIPVANKKDPSKHYGYFILMDDHGKSIENSGYVKNINEDTLSQIRATLKSTTGKAPTIKNIDELKDTLFLSKLEKYLKNSVYKNLNDISMDVDENLLLTVSEMILKKSKIKILFLPEEIVSYYAVNFRQNGTGKSLLERVVVLMSIRAILLFTNLLSYIKSSVTTTDVKVDLDPEDINYRKTMKQIMGEVIKNRQISLPIGMLKIDDLVDWVHKLGFSFNFKHPGLPDVNIDVEETVNKIEPIDTSLKEMIDKLIITSLYLTPEIIDNSYSPDFATTIIANNKLLSKRIQKLQNKYNILITKDIRKKLKLDGKFKIKLREYITPNIKNIKEYLIKNSPDTQKELFKNIDDEVLINWFINKIIDNITLTLTKPEVTEDRNINDMFSNYVDLLDESIDKIFSTDLIPSEYMGDIGDNVDDIKGLIKHVLIRKYMNENNILPEFNKMFILDEDGKPVFNILEEFENFNKILEAVVLPFIEQNKKHVKTVNNKMSKIENDDASDNE